MGLAGRCYPFNGRFPPSSRRFPLPSPRLSPLMGGGLWLFAFTLLTGLVVAFQGPLTLWDIVILRFLHESLAHPFLDTFALILSRMGKNPLLWSGLLFWLGWEAKRRGQGWPWWVWALVTLAVTIATTDAFCGRVFKPLVGRERPARVVPSLRPIAGAGRAKSYPSAHAANAFAVARVLSALVPPKTVWWGLACGIALSRLYLGAHYPTDILGGIFWGLSVGAFFVALWKRWVGGKEGKPNGEGP